MRIAAERPPWYITTSIPYVNARPHLGHALEYVQTDALARYHRLDGADVRFLTGTDENSLKNVRAAERAALPVQELVDRNAAYYCALRDTLELSFDDFIRTSVDPRHLGGVHKLWQACAQNGDIYTRAYRGRYCVGCEQFYAEEELVDGLCPEHQVPPELIGVANKYVVEVKPWALAKAGADQRLATTLYNLAETLRLVAYALAPFLPTTAERIAAQLGFTIDTSTPLGEALAWGGYLAGTAVQPGDILFPKCSVTADERPTTNDE